MWSILGGLLTGGIGTYIKMGLFAAAAVAVVVAYNVNAQRLINKGWDRAIASVQKQNDAGKAAGDKAQNDIDKCYEREGYWWNVVSGKCEEEVATK